MTKARKYNSALLQGLLDEVTPLEMEQTKVKMLLAARIEDVMLEKGWSKSQFAEKMGKSPSEITKWLSGTQNFTVEVLTAIATVFHVEFPSLFEKKQEKEIALHFAIKVKAKVNTPPIKYVTPVMQDVDITAFMKNVFGSISSKAVDSQHLKRA